MDADLFRKPSCNGGPPNSSRIKGVAGVSQTEIVRGPNQRRTFAANNAIAAAGKVDLLERNDFNVPLEKIIASLYIGA